MTEDTNIITEAKEFVQELLSTELAEGMDYHNFDHTFEVWQSSREISKLEGLSDEDNQIVELAALFHDTGFVKVYKGHEEASKEIAKAFLMERGYSGEAIARIGELIMSTRMGTKANTLLEKILCDADMSHVGGKKYAKKKEALRNEWAAFMHTEMNDLEWNDLNVDFLAKQEFYTKSAHKLYSKGKNKNLEKMKATKAKPVPSHLSSSRSAQMMFKTALRNHIDLTNLADNKANIMMSINAIIITISLPYLPGYIQDHPELIIPAGFLLATCLSSVVVATLATRPIATTGRAKPEKIKTGEANLFFFGNFYKMSLKEYTGYIQEVIASEEVLEKSITSDLYYLGSSLGRKFKLLRVTYNIFSIGMILTVLSLLVANYFAHN